MDPDSSFKVNLYQAKLIIKQTKRPLTLDIAKQLPIIWYEEARLKGQPLPPPICKVLKETIADPISDELLLKEHEITWLYLIDRSVADLAWVIPFVKDAEGVHQQGILGEGGWINDPDQVETAIL